MLLSWSCYTICKLQNAMAVCYKCLWCWMQWFFCFMHSLLYKVDLLWESLKHQFWFILRLITALKSLDWIQTHCGNDFSDAESRKTHKLTFILQNTAPDGKDIQCISVNSTLIAPCELQSMVMKCVCSCWDNDSHLVVNQLLSMLYLFNWVKSKIAVFFINYSLFWIGKLT